jgi:hypothetical protein
MTAAEPNSPRYFYALGIDNVPLLLQRGTARPTHTLNGKRMNLCVQRVMETRVMTNRTSIAVLINMMVSAVLFGIGATTVLSIPELSDQATILLPLVIAMSLLISPFISWYLAPRLRAAWVRQMENKRRRLERRAHATRD